MEIIRLATSEEVEKLKEVTDLATAQSVVVQGKGCAVLRTRLEADPIVFQPDANPSERAVFMFALFNGLAMSGAPEVYFSFPETLPAGLERLGLAPVNPKDLRFKKVLR